MLFAISIACTAIVIVPHIIADLNLHNNFLTYWGHRTRKNEDSAGGTMRSPASTILILSRAG